MNILIAVCTRDRPQMLASCISSLKSCDTPPGVECRILIVDNGSSGDSGRKIGAFSDQGTVVLVEKMLGIPFARNSALEYAAQHRIDALVFVDDDQIAPRNWLHTLIKVWVEEQADVVKTAVEWDFPARAPYRRFFEESPLPSSAHRMVVRDLATNGVLISKRLFVDWGLRFSTRYPLLGGTDSKFFDESFLLGGRHIKTNESFIIEKCPPSQMNFRWLVRRKFRNGASLALLRIKMRPPYYYFISGLFHAIKALLLFIIKLLTKGDHEMEVLNLAKAVGLIFGSLGLGVDEYRVTNGA